MDALKSFLSRFLEPPSVPGDSEDHPLELCAIPGLMTLLDVALCDAAEGELTATLTSSHKLLLAWLDLKKQAVLVLKALEIDVGRSKDGGRRARTEGFARACLDAACDATDRMSTDRLASSANLSDPFESLAATTSTSSGPHILSGVSLHSLERALEDSAADAGRRYYPQALRGRDCWESPRLYCPDYVWADDVAQHSHRLLRHLHRHAFGGDREQLPPPQPGEAARMAGILWELVQTDLPARLLQFRASVEADGSVLKRLYLVKCECRAPFRAFLEAHQSILKAPSPELVDEYLQASSSSPSRGSKGGAQAHSKGRESAQDLLSSLLEDNSIAEALALERACATSEMELARALHPFCELARYLDHKRARLKPVPTLLEDPGDVADLQETLRRLKGLLCRKSGPDTSAGIRPLLLDVQGVPRDEERVRYVGSAFGSDVRDAPLDEEAMAARLESLVEELELLSRLARTPGAFQGERRGGEVDVPPAVARGCADFDGELFVCRYQDWYAWAVRQREALRGVDVERFAEDLRKAEVRVSLSVAPASSLMVVRERVHGMIADRDKRFGVLRDMVEEVCLREVNLHVRVSAPGASEPLSLRPTSARGVFGLPLQMAGEVLPLG